MLKRNEEHHKKLSLVWKRRIVRRCHFYPEITTIGEVRTKSRQIYPVGFLKKTVNWEWICQRNISVVTWHMWTLPPLFYIIYIFYFYVRIDSDWTCSFFFFFLFLLCYSLYFSLDKGLFFCRNPQRMFLKMRHLLRFIFDMFVVVEVSENIFLFFCIFMFLIELNIMDAWSIVL